MATLKILFKLTGPWIILGSLLQAKLPLPSPASSSCPHSSVLNKHRSLSSEHTLVPPAAVSILGKPLRNLYPRSHFQSFSKGLIFTMGIWKECVRAQHFSNPVGATVPSGNCPWVVLVFLFLQPRDWPLSHALQSGYHNLVTSMNIMELKAESTLALASQSCLSR